MIIPDINLLIYAHNAAAQQHAAARRWWEALLGAERSVGIPWAVAMGFIRLVTHPNVLEAPLRPAMAVELVKAWFSVPSVRVVETGPRHLELLEELSTATGVLGSLTTDTHLAALAIEHQAELHSNDLDFTRFPGLKWHNPLL
ncbi:MAG: TA system VapC family ribonuclease toxin [Myxococcaceae bacterium]